jgi:hypothetical protein
MMHHGLSITAERLESYYTIVVTLLPCVFVSNGSVVVDFKVVYRRDPVLNKKIVVAETVKEEIIKTGKLGTFDLKEVTIAGNRCPSMQLFNHLHSTYRIMVIF